jgi:hypothetical protein
MPKTLQAMRESLLWPARTVAVEKGTKMAAKWRLPAEPFRAEPFRAEPFPHIRRRCSERPGAVKGTPLLGAAKRTLDRKDRSEMIAEEGKAGTKAWRKVGRHFGTLARRLQHRSSYRHR